MSRKRERSAALSATDRTQPLACFCRDVSDLFVHPVTHRCATRDRCVACAYKIACFDVALDFEFCRAIPNVRPELCPRASGPRKVKASSGFASSDLSHDDEPSQGHVLGYRPGLRVLTLGDGDLSFSLAVARLVGRKGGQRQPHVYATSYETLETLRAVYDNIDDTLRELRALNVKVVFRVDATRLKETLFSSEKEEEGGKAQLASERRFDRIVWNFPCAAVQGGRDGQNGEMDRNKEMVRRFVSQARRYLADDGQIHMNHKTKPPFNQWRIEQVAVQDSQESPPVVGYLGRVVLDKSLLPPYAPRKALCRKSFPVHDACTYVFGLLEAGGPRRSDPSGERIAATSAGGERAVAPWPGAGPLLPVTAALIRSLRGQLLRSNPAPADAPHSRAKRRKGGAGRQY